MMGQRGILILAGLLVTLTAGSVPAAGGKEKETFLSEKEVFEQVCENADISEKEITRSNTEFDFEDGRAVYEIEVHTSESKYEFVIDAESGIVVQREMEKKEESNGASPTGSYIEVGDAKAIALEDAGYNADEVIFSKAKRDKDDGHVKYEIEFVVKGVAEFEYEIDALTGEIYKMSRKAV